MPLSFPTSWLLRSAPVAILFLLFSLSGVASAQTILDFDAISGARVSSQYNDRGATLNFPMLRDFSAFPGFAHSGSHAVELCFAEEFCKSELRAKFTTGQTRVKVFVGFTSQLGPAAAAVRLVALDENGAVVDDDIKNLGPSSGPIPVSLELEVQSASPNIREVRAGFEAADSFNNGLVFDDLTLDVAGPPRQCTATADPIVRINQPASGETVQLNQFLLSGSIFTGAPLETAILTIRGPANQVKNSDLLGGLVKPLTAPYGPTNMTGSLFIGTNLITLTARNCHGSGEASTTILHAPAAQGTQVRLLGMEIVQATQRVDNSIMMIRDKPTVVRLYFSTMGGAPIGFVRGMLAGHKQGGNVPFLAQSGGTVTIGASTDLQSMRRLGSASMNFVLSPDFYGPGLLHFRLVRLFVDGPGGETLTCAGCQNWTAQFPNVPQMNLVVQPFRYLFSSLTADSGTSLFNALRFLNNVYPLKGDFPVDGSGIRLIRLPTVPLELKLPEQNGQVLSRLEEILDDLKSQPGSGVPADARILGIGPSGRGGVARMNSNVAYGDSRAVEHQIQADDPETYGANWAQEIGHSFDVPHMSTAHGEMPPSDPDFPVRHGGIGEPGVAVGTQTWNGTPFVIDPGTPVDGMKHAHDFMSYGSPNDANHTNDWVSPFVYEKLRSEIIDALPAAAAALAPAADKLVVGGVIDAGGRATFRPFRIVRTSFIKGSGESGGLAVHLLDESGRTLSSHRFETRASTDGQGSGFNEFIPWDSRTRRIELRRGKSMLAARTVSRTPPIISSIGVKLGAGGDRTRISWAAGDRDGDRLSFTVLYNSGLDSRWIPLAHDVAAGSTYVDTKALPGSGKARFRVRASDGVHAAERDSAPLPLPDAPPVPVILNAPYGAPIEANSLRLEGAAYDPQDGLLPANRLQWKSDRDGWLGTGSIVHCRLSRGKHVITLSAMNRRGTVAFVRREIVVR